MDIGAVNLNQPPSSSQTGAVKQSDTLGKDDFLMLLVTQLRYQNPSDPMSNESFIAQSAQFSALEEMKSLNSSIQTLVDLQKTSSRTAALNLIGKNVEALQSDTMISNGTPTDLTYSISEDANIALTIYDADGNPVRSMDAGKQSPGDYALGWDGMDDNGNRLSDGTYSYKVSATDADGDDVSVSGSVSGIVESLAFNGNEPYISIRGMYFPLTAVVEVDIDTPPAN